MLSYVTFDAGGNLTGSYLQELSQEHYQNHIEVDATVRANWPLYRANALRDGVELIPLVPPSLDSIKKDLVTAIDDHVAKIIEKWTRFKEGYAKREAAARAYKAVGYSGDATRWVTSFATYAGKTNQQAADTIIAQADGLNLALEDLEDLRMRKYNIIRASDVDAIHAEHNFIMTSINSIAGGLG